MHPWLLIRIPFRKSLEPATAVFCTKDILKDLQNFTGKHLCFQKQPVSLFFKTLLKRLQHRCFPAKFANVLRKPVLKNICE